MIAAPKMGAVQDTQCDLFALMLTWVSINPGCNLWVSRLRRLRRLRLDRAHQDTHPNSGYS